MNEPSEEEIVKAITQKVKEAERNLLNTLQHDLFSGSSDAVMFAYEPPTLAEKITTAAWKVYYFFRCRVVGVWNVLKKGECGSCEQDDYRWE